MRYNIDGFYKMGFKWCSYCAEKKQAEGVYCPDCNRKLRTKPLSKRRKTNGNKI